MTSACTTVTVVFPSLLSQKDPRGQYQHMHGVRSPIQQYPIASEMDTTGIRALSTFYGSYVCRNKDLRMSKRRCMALA